jgi:hypothetical protein
LDSVFKVLAKKPTAKYVSKRKVGNTDLSYISWADAWTALMTVYPDATYEVIKDVDTNLPYFGSDIGFMVETKITVNSISRNMIFLSFIFISIFYFTFFTIITVTMLTNRLILSFILLLTISIPIKSCIFSLIV